MGIPTLVILYLYIETAPRSLSSRELYIIRHTADDVVTQQWHWPIFIDPCPDVLWRVNEQNSKYLPPPFNSCLLCCGRLDWKSQACFCFCLKLFGFRLESKRNYWINRAYLRPQQALGCVQARLHIKVGVFLWNTLLYFSLNKKHERNRFAC